MATGDGSTTAQWQKREHKVFEKVESARLFYSTCSEFNRKWSRRVSIIVMICTALAPIFVVSASTESDFFYKGFNRYAAIIITLILALAEGTKRIFRFEQRWATCYMANRALTSVRDQYRIQRIGKDVGSLDWITNFLEFRDNYETITNTESKQFFEAMKLGDTPASTSTANGAADSKEVKPQS